MAELDALDNESDDIYEKGLIDHYQKRPVSLEETCLADFASWYEFQTRKKRGRPILQDGKQPLSFFGIQHRRRIYVNYAFIF